MGIYYVGKVPNIGQKFNWEHLLMLAYNIYLDISKKRFTFSFMKETMKLILILNPYKYNPGVI